METTAKTRLSYRSEVVGSLLRPEYLKQAFERFEHGAMTADELTEVQDRAALEAIRLQEDCGLDVLTDGEVRRRFWFDPLTASLGYDYRASAPVPFTSGGQRQDEAPPKLPVVTQRLRIVDNLPLREYRFVRAHARTPTKTTIAGMTYASVLWVPGVSDGSYAGRDEYMADVLRLMKELVRRVVEAGTGYGPLHSPRYTHMVSDEGRENLRRVGLDVETWLESMIAFDNELIE